MKAALLRTRITAEATFEVDETEPVITGWELNREHWYRVRHVFVYLHLEDDEWLWHHVVAHGHSGWSDGLGWEPSRVDYHRDQHELLPTWLVELVGSAVQALDKETNHELGPGYPMLPTEEAPDAPAD